MKCVLRMAFFAVAVLSLPATALEQDAASLVLVERIVQAYGGASVIERITSVNAQGDIIALMRGAHGSYQRWFARTHEHIQTIITEHLERLLGHVKKKPFRLSF